MAPLITLNPGYPSEQTVDPQQLQVPDLWHLAMWLKGISEHIEVIKEHADTSEREHIKALDIAIGYLNRIKDGEVSSGLVLETWHLAHALKEYIRKEAARMPYGPPLSVCRSCLLWDTQEGLGGDGDIGAAYILATPDNCQSQQHPVEVKTEPALAKTGPARDVVSSGPCYCPEHEHHDGPCMGPECRCHFDR